MGPSGVDPYSTAAVGGAYDLLAAAYDRRFGRDLERVPVEGGIVDRLAQAAPPGSVVLEVGAGPAPAARRLATRDLLVVAVDLAPSMLRVARDAAPALPALVGDCRRLPVRDGSVHVVIAFYVLQHLPRPELPAALAAMWHVLEPGGRLGLAVHLGHGEVVVDELAGSRVGPLGGTFFEREELLGALTASGFTVEVAEERDPLPHEHQGRRLLAVGRRPGDT